MAASVKAQGQAVRRVPVFASLRTRILLGALCACAIVFWIARDRATMSLAFDNCVQALAVQIGEDGLDHYFHCDGHADAAAAERGYSKGKLVSERLYDEDGLLIEALFYSPKGHEHWQEISSARAVHNAISDDGDYEEVVRQTFRITAPDGSEALMTENSELFRSSNQTLFFGKPAHPYEFTAVRRYDGVIGPSNSVKITSLGRYLLEGRFYVPLSVKVEVEGETDVIDLSPIKVLFPTEEGFAEIAVNLGSD